MKILRKQELETKDIIIGDQIQIELKGIGIFTATAQKIDSEGILFMFDECVGMQPMNKKNTNEGGFEKSDLSKWLQSEFRKILPDTLSKRIKNITLPTYGQIFGHDLFYKIKLAEDNDDQFILMKNIKNRISTYKNDTEWYWLQNSVKPDLSSTFFAYVNHYGNANYHFANGSHGVRPVFHFV